MGIWLKTLQTIDELTGKFNSLIFSGTGNTENKSKRFEYSILLLIYAAGVMHWLWFLNFGSLGFQTNDWNFQFNYYTMLRTAICSHVMPYHISSRFVGLTDRFFSIGEISFSPQVLLLTFMSIGRFVLINTLILYTAGFAGCLLLKRRLGLSIFPFTILFLLFNFNGHITSHIAVGHFGWLGYFLLPFFFFYCFELDGISGQQRAAPMIALTLFLILLQGGIHIFVWCVIFTALLAIFNKSYFKRACAALLLSIPLSLFRLAPAAITFTGVNHSFMIGYPNIAVMLDAFVNIRNFSYMWLNSGLKILNWWEYDIYTDITGLLVIITFGVLLRNIKKYELIGVEYKKFDIPIILFLFFSFNYMYYFVTCIPVPLLNSERVTSRFIIMPFLYLLIFACARLEKFIKLTALNAKQKLLALGLTAQMALALAIHSRAWSLPAIEQHTASAQAGNVLTLINRPDAFYALCVKLSFAVSLLSFIAIVLFVVLKKPPLAIIQLNEKEISCKNSAQL